MTSSFIAWYDSILIRIIESKPVIPIKASNLMTSSFIYSKFFYEIFYFLFYFLIKMIFFIKRKVSMVKISKISYLCYFPRRNFAVIQKSLDHWFIVIINSYLCERQHMCFMTHLSNYLPPFISYYCKSPIYKNIYLFTLWSMVY